VHAKGLPWTISLLALAVIALVTFLLDTQTLTDRQTELLRDTSEHTTYAMATIVLHNQW